VSGQDFFCIDAWPGKINFKHNRSMEDINSLYPNSVAAVDATDGIIMTHPSAGTILGVNAIDAQFRDDTGEYTSDGEHPWLKSVYDPISTGTPKVGMGQHGSKRWAWGESEGGGEFPQWDFRRILAHYYTMVSFTGVSPSPPDHYRSNMLDTAYGLYPQDGIGVRKGEEWTGFGLLYQNVGHWSWPTNEAYWWGGCTYNDPPFKTLLSYHLYRQDGTLACSNCLGIRRTPMCGSSGALSPSEDHWVNGFHIFIPDDPAIVEGQTYLLRFDVEHRYDMVWQGYPDFNWPPQDIPVFIEETPGSNEPQVSVDRPPAVTTSPDLSFSWSGVNADTFDLENRSKEIGQVEYSGGFQVILSNSPDQAFSASVECDEDRLDWEFRIRGRKDGQAGDWNYFTTQTRVYPHAWLTYDEISVLVADDSNGPWSRPLNIINLGGGGFTWNATSNRSWISVNASGEGPGSLGVTLSKPGGVGDYEGTITVTLTDWQPSPNCGPTGFGIPVLMQVRHLPYSIRGARRTVPTYGHGKWTHGTE
jgi:hypothetical protein